MGESADDTEGSITWAGFLAAERQLTATGCCQHPIRLRGRIDAIDLATGELAPVYDTATEPGGVLMTACGNRRETVCPACSAGLQARRPPARPRRAVRRQGHPGDRRRASVRVRHPHRPLLRPGPRPPPCAARPCCPADPAATTSSAAARTAATSPARKRHADDDPRLGRPMCADCYDYTAAVLFNAHAGELWRRFTTYLPRHFARLTGLTLTELRDVVAIRYVKVAEYQARGVVHFHAIIRLDAPGDDLPAARPVLHRRDAVRRHRPGRRHRSHHHRPRTRPSRDHAAVRQPDRRPARPARTRPARHRPGAVRPGRRQLHRQVRHQGPRRARHPRPSAPLRARTSPACGAAATTPR